MIYKSKHKRKQQVKGGVIMDLDITKEDFKAFFSLEGFKDTVLGILNLDDFSQFKWEIESWMIVALLILAVILIVIVLIGYDIALGGKFTFNIYWLFVVMIVPVVTGISLIVLGDKAYVWENGEVYSYIKENGIIQQEDNIEIINIDDNKAIIQMGEDKGIKEVEVDVKYTKGVKKPYVEYYILDKGVLGYKEDEPYFMTLIIDKKEKGE